MASRARLARVNLADKVNLEAVNVAAPPMASNVTRAAIRTALLVIGAQEAAAARPTDTSVNSSPTSRATPTPTNTGLEATRVCAPHATTPIAPLAIDAQAAAAARPTASSVN